MRRLFLSMAVAAATMLAAGCFKPDSAETGENTDKLEGYWETVHLSEIDIWHYSYPDGTSTGQESYVDEYDITPDDGHEEWKIFRFHGGTVTLVASDCYDDEGMYGVPYPYSISGNKLSGGFFCGDYANHVTYEFNGDDELVLYLEDKGTTTDEDDGTVTHDDYKSWTTLRRYEPEE